MASAVRAIAPDHPLAPQVARPVVIYVDRSGSMKGYLDATSTDPRLNVASGRFNLRTLLIQLLALGSSGRTVVGFGERADTLTGSEAGLYAALVSQPFYRERETRTEDAFALVRADSRQAAVHLIVTDGRRDDGPTTIAQYQQLGELAAAWTRAGGVFAIAASMAPFKQPRRDRSGCRQAQPDSSGRCPLYVFAFIPATAAERTLEALKHASERLYAYPALSDARVEIHHAVGGRPEPVSLNVLPARAFVLGIRSNTAPRQPVSAEVSMVFDTEKSVARFALGDSLAWQLERTAVRREPPAQWTEADARVQPRALQAAGSTLTLPLTLRTYAGVPPALYRLRVSRVGSARWMREYEAERHGDALRTYGLSAVFANLRPQPAVLTGGFVVVY